MPINHGNDVASEQLTNIMSALLMLHAADSATPGGADLTLVCVWSGQVTSHGGRGP